MLAVLTTCVTAEAQIPFAMAPGFPLFPLIYNARPAVHYHEVEEGQERSLEKTGCRNNEGTSVPCAHAEEPSHEARVTPRPYFVLPYGAVEKGM